MADLYDLLVAPDEVSAQEQAQALSAALRRQKAVGMLGAFSGDKVLAPLGQQMMQGGDQTERGMLGVAQGRLTRAMQAEQAAQQAAAQRQRLMLQAAQAGETARHNRAVESQGRYSFTAGDDGRLWAGNTRTGGVDLVKDQAGNPVLMPKKAGKAPPPLQRGDREALGTMASDLGSIEGLVAEFRPEYAGGGPLGGAVVSLEQKLGSFAGNKAQKEAQFWTNFARLVDLPQRNEVFGASLSPGEKASWEQAKNITPRHDPKVVKAALDQMAEIYRAKLAAHADSLAVDGYRPEAIAAAAQGMIRPRGAGDDGGDIDLTGGGMVRVRNAQGEEYEIPESDLAEAEQDGFMAVR